MPTTYTDQFYVIDPGNPPARGTGLSVQNSSFVDSNDDGLITTNAGDTFEGSAITRVWLNDTVTVRIPGVGQVTVTGVTFYVSGQPAVFTPTDGTILQDATFIRSTYVNSSTQVEVGSLAPACFTPGTLIETIEGPRPIEAISVGDLVLTAGCGYQPVIWVGRGRVAAEGRFAPIRIAAGALGNDRDLVVSPQHRVLIEGWAAELYAGQDAVMVPAKHLVDGKKIHVIEGGHVEYLHLAFETHALVRSEGIWTESHFATVAARAEGRALFGDMPAAARLARPEAMRHESLLMSASLLF